MRNWIAKLLGCCCGRVRFEVLSAYNRETDRDGTVLQVLVLKVYPPGLEPDRRVELRCKFGGSEEWFWVAEIGFDDAEEFSWLMQDAVKFERHPDS